MAVQRTFPVIPDTSRSVNNEFRTLRNMIYDLQDVGLTAASAAKTAVTGTTGATGAVGPAGPPGASGTSVPVAQATINLSQFIGLLSQAQRAFIPEYTSLPNIQDPITQDGALISVNGILYRFDGSTQPGVWKPQAAVAAIIEDTYAHWVKPAYDPANFAVGTLFFDTTRKLIYAIEVVSSANAWVYIEGTYAVTQSTIPTKGFNGANLGVNDTGLLLNITDYAHVLQWSGSGWTWGPGESGSGYIADFAVAPTGSGWHACDGSAGVAYLKSDGTTGTVTLPNTNATAAYRKLTSAYSAVITAKVVPTISGHTETGTANITDTPLNNVAVTGAATAATHNTEVDSGHTHNLTAANAPIALPGDPIPNYAAISYFRQ